MSCIVCGKSDKQLSWFKEKDARRTIRHIHITCLKAVDQTKQEFTFAIAHGGVAQKFTAEAVTVETIPL